MGFGMRCICFSSGIWKPKFKFTVYEFSRAKKIVVEAELSVVEFI
jgi:hypothetical protein